VTIPRSEEPIVIIIEEMLTPSKIRFSMHHLINELICYLPAKTISAFSFMSARANDIKADVITSHLMSDHSKNQSQMKSNAGKRKELADTIIMVRTAVNERQERWNAGSNPRTKIQQHKSGTDKRTKRPLFAMTQNAGSMKETL
jgi:hypothetical protein